MLYSPDYGQRDLAVENCEEPMPRSRLPKGRRQIPRNRNLNFLPKHGLYVCDFPGQKELPLNDLPVLGDDNDSDDDEDEPTPRICATTADQNKLLYTLREVKAADASRQLVKSTHPWSTCSP